MASGSGGRVLAALAALTVALLACGADADCFDYCYKNCVANDKSMADYCNYACDKTCAPGGGFPIRCQIDCVRRTCTGLRQDRKGIVACYRGCFDGCKTKTSEPDHPFHEKQDAVPVRPAAVPDHPFHQVPNEQVN